MAFVVSAGARSLVKRLSNIPVRNSVLRTISTSEKKKDGAAIHQPIAKDQAIPDFSKPLENKNWVSYGFNRNDEKADLNFMHSFYFFSVTLVLIVGGFFFAYYPDFKSQDWAQREAYLELRRRELAGLPLIDRDYVDPALIKLPTDEELGDRPIII